jgi:glycine/D-amino acid oxidase-like deaminating enzyme
MAEPLPPSLWAATAEPAPRIAVLEGVTSVDVAIVGGGICGLSAALHLAEGGTSVAVLEAREPGWGASGRNGGQVIPGFKDRPSVLRGLYGENLGQRMAMLGLAAGDVVHDIIMRHGLECQYRRQGWINAVHGRKALKLAEQRASEWQELGAPIRMLDRAETASLLGADGYVAGYLDPRGAALNPLSYFRGLARAAIAAGAAVYGNATVKAIGRRGDRWLLTAPAGIVLAYRVLFATGAYSDGVVRASSERSCPCSPSRSQPGRSRTTCVPPCFRRATWLPMSAASCSTSGSTKRAGWSLGGAVRSGRRR